MAQSGLTKRRQLAMLVRLQKGLCSICGGRMDPQPFGDVSPRLNEATLDHFVPQSLGGKSHMENLTASHYRCNHVRSSATPSRHLQATYRALQPLLLMERLREANRKDHRWEMAA